MARVPVGSNTQWQRVLTKVTPSGMEGVTLFSMLVFNTLGTTERATVRQDLGSEGLAGHLEGLDRNRLEDLPEDPAGHLADRPERL